MFLDQGVYHIVFIFLRVICVSVSVSSLVLDLYSFDTAILVRHWCVAGYTLKGMLASRPGLAVVPHAIIRIMTTLSVDGL